LQFIFAVLLYTQASSNTLAKNKQQQL